MDNAIKLKQLRHVMALARAGNYAKAAAELNIPQPVLSRSIKEIEQQYGMKLFDRGRFGAALTPAGYLIINDIEDILQKVDGLSRTLTSMPRKGVQRIRFAASPMAAAILLPRLAAATIRQRPELAIDAEVQSMEHFLPWLQNGSIEFAICLEHTTSIADNLRIEPIGRTRTGYIVRKGHPLLTKRQITPGDMAQYPSVTSWNAPPPHDAMICCNDYQIQKEITKLSDAVWLASLDFIADDDDLEVLKLRNAVADTRTICVMTPINRKHSENYFFMLQTLKDICADYS